EHALGSRWSVSLYAASERVFHFVPEGDFVFGGGGRGRRRGTLFSLPSKATFNHADDPYDPHRGFILAFTAEPTKGPRASFVKTTAEGRLYLPAGDDRVLAARLKLGGILGGGSLGDIPPTRRFFAGGQSSLRAFRYGVLGPLAEEGKVQGGKGLLEFSTELRFPLTPALTGVLFADAGNASRKPFATGGLTLYSDAGGGLRFKTPVGPVGLDLAFKLKRTPVDRSAYQVAFYAGYAF
ncbi:MAG: BamA/TamA family outer membrane protein, partial [Acidobacteriota bacterium]